MNSLISGGKTAPALADNRTSAVAYPAVLVLRLTALHFPVLQLAFSHYCHVVVSNLN
jgi:hypothetical protein